MASSGYKTHLKDKKELVSWLIILVSLRSAVKIGFMDDITLAGDFSTVEADVNTIRNHSAETGLQLNLGKYEIITDNKGAISKSSLFSHFMKVNKQDMTLLGAPVIKPKISLSDIKSSSYRELWNGYHSSILTMHWFC